MDNSEYIGNELHIFKAAKNWKKYWLKSVANFIEGEVLEVGAGIGVNTELLLNSCKKITKLTAVEPDHILANEITQNQKIDKNKVDVKVGYLKSLPITKKFDTILYIDVIEHIEDDKAEMDLAMSYLKEGGHLIVLVPAYNSLFSPFDKAIGHFRRYNKKMLKESIPKELKRRKIFYLDSLGALASLTNKLILKQSSPTEKQILKWDRIIVPTSKIVDIFIFRSAGKSLIGVWKK